MNFDGNYWIGSSLRHWIFLNFRTGADKVDGKFVDDAMRELLKSRQILKGSYPYAYFLDNLKGVQSIFEFMQVSSELSDFLDD